MNIKLLEKNKKTMFMFWTLTFLSFYLIISSFFYLISPSIDTSRLMDSLKFDGYITNWLFCYNPTTKIFFIAPSAFWIYLVPMFAGMGVLITILLIFKHEVKGEKIISNKGLKLAKILKKYTLIKFLIWNSFISLIIIEVLARLAINPYIYGSFISMSGSSQHSFISSFEITTSSISNYINNKAGLLFWFDFARWFNFNVNNKTSKSIIVVTNAMGYIPVITLFILGVISISKGLKSWNMVANDIVNLIFSNDYTKINPKLLNELRTKFFENNNISTQSLDSVYDDENTEEEEDEEEDRDEEFDDYFSNTLYNEDVIIKDFNFDDETVDDKTYIKFLNDDITEPHALYLSEPHKKIIGKLEPEEEENNEEIIDQAEPEGDANFSSLGNEPINWEQQVPIERQSNFNRQEFLKGLVRLEEKFEQLISSGEVDFSNPYEDYNITEDIEINIPNMIINNNTFNGNVDKKNKKDGSKNGSKDDSKDGETDSVFFDSDGNQKLLDENDPFAIRDNDLSDKKNHFSTDDDEMESEFFTTRHGDTVEEDIQNYEVRYDEYGNPYYVLYDEYGKEYYMMYDENGVPYYTEYDDFGNLVYKIVEDKPIIAPIDESQLTASEQIELSEQIKGIEGAEVDEIKEKFLEEVARKRAAEAAAEDEEEESEDDTEKQFYILNDEDIEKTRYFDIKYSANKKRILDSTDEDYEEVKIDDDRIDKLAVKWNSAIKKYYSKKFPKSNINKDHKWLDKNKYFGNKKTKISSSEKIKITEIEFLDINKNSKQFLDYIFDTLANIKAFELETNPSVFHDPKNIRLFRGSLETMKKAQELYLQGIIYELNDFENDIDRYVYKNDDPIFYKKFYYDKDNVLKSVPDEFVTYARDPKGIMRPLNSKNEYFEKDAAVQTSVDNRFFKDEKGIYNKIIHKYVGVALAEERSSIQVGDKNKRIIPYYINPNGKKCLAQKEKLFIVTKLGTVIKISSNLTYYDKDEDKIADALEYNIFTRNDNGEIVRVNFDTLRTYWKTDREIAKFKNHLFFTTVDYQYILALKPNSKLYAKNESGNFVEVDKQMYYKNLSNEKVLLETANCYINDGDKFTKVTYKEFESLSINRAYIEKKFERKGEYDLARERIEEILQKGKIVTQKDKFEIMASTNISLNRLDEIIEDTPRVSKTRLHKKSDSRENNVVELIKNICTYKNSNGVDIYVPNKNVFVKNKKGKNTVIDSDFNYIDHNGETTSALGKNLFTLSENKKVIKLKTRIAYKKIGTIEDELTVEKIELYYYDKDNLLRKAEKDDKIFIVDDKRALVPVDANYEAKVAGQKVTAATRECVIKVKGKMFNAEFKKSIYKLENDNTIRLFGVEDLKPYFVNKEGEEIILEIKDVLYKNEKGKPQSSNRSYFVQDSAGKVKPINYVECIFINNIDQYEKVKWKVSVYNIEHVKNQNIDAFKIKVAQNGFGEFKEVDTNEKIFIKKENNYIEIFQEGDAYKDRSGNPLSIDQNEPKFVNRNLNYQKINEVIDPHKFFEYNNILYTTQRQVVYIGSEDDEIQILNKSEKVYTWDLSWTQIQLSEEYTYHEEENVVSGFGKKAIVKDMHGTEIPVNWANIRTKVYLSEFNSLDKIVKKTYIIDSKREIWKNKNSNLYGKNSEEKYLQINDDFAIETDNGILTFEPGSIYIKKNNKYYLLHWLETFENISRLREYDDYSKIADFNHDEIWQTKKNFEAKNMYKDYVDDDFIENHSAYNEFLDEPGSESEELETIADYGSTMDFGYDEEEVVEKTYNDKYREVPKPIKYKGILIDKWKKPNIYVIDENGNKYPADFSKTFVIDYKGETYKVNDDFTYKDDSGSVTKVLEDDKCFELGEDGTKKPITFEISKPSPLIRLSSGENLETDVKPAKIIITPKNEVLKVNDDFTYVNTKGELVEVTNEKIYLIDKLGNINEYSKGEIENAVPFKALPRNIKKYYIDNNGKRKYIKKENKIFVVNRKGDFVNVDNDDNYIENNGVKHSAEAKEKFVKNNDGKFVPLNIEEGNSEKIYYSIDRQGNENKFSKEQLFTKDIHGELIKLNENAQFKDSNNNLVDADVNKLFAKDSSGEFVKVKVKEKSLSKKPYIKKDNDYVSVDGEQLFTKEKDGTAKPLNKDLEYLNDNGKSVTASEDNIYIKSGGNLKKVVLKHEDELNSKKDKENLKVKDYYVLDEFGSPFSIDPAQQLYYVDGNGDYRKYDPKTIKEENKEFAKEKFAKDINGKFIPVFEREKEAFISIDGNVIPLNGKQIFIKDEKGSFIPLDGELHYNNIKDNDGKEKDTFILNDRGEFVGVKWKEKPKEETIEGKSSIISKPKGYFKDSSGDLNVVDGNDLYKLDYNGEFKLINDSELEELFANEVEISETKTFVKDDKNNFVPVEWVEEVPCYTEETGKIIPVGEKTIFTVNSEDKFVPVNSKFEYTDPNGENKKASPDELYTKDHAGKFVSVTWKVEDDIKEAAKPKYSINKPFIINEKGETKEFVEGTIFTPNNEGEFVPVDVEMNFINEKGEVVSAIDREIFTKDDDGNYKPAKWKETSSYYRDNNGKKIYLQDSEQIYTLNDANQYSAISRDFTYKNSDGKHYSAIGKPLFFKTANDLFIPINWEIKEVKNADNKYRKESQFFVDPDGNKIYVDQNEVYTKNDVNEYVKVNGNGMFENSNGMLSRLSDNQAVFSKNENGEYVKLESEILKPYFVNNNGKKELFENKKMFIKKDDKLLPLDENLNYKIKGEKNKVADENIFIIDDDGQHKKIEWLNEDLYNKEKNEEQNNYKAYYADSRGKLISVDDQQMFALSSEGVHVPVDNEYKYIDSNGNEVDASKQILFTKDKSGRFVPIIWKYNSNKPISFYKEVDGRDIRTNEKTLYVSEDGKYIKLDKNLLYKNKEGIIASAKEDEIFVRNSQGDYCPVFWKQPSSSSTDSINYNELLNNKRPYYSEENGSKRWADDSNLFTINSDGIYLKLNSDFKYTDEEGNEHLAPLTEIYTKNNNGDYTKIEWKSSERFKFPFYKNEINEDILGEGLKLFALSSSGKMMPINENNLYKDDDGILKEASENNLYVKGINDDPVKLFWKNLDFIEYNVAKEEKEKEILRLSQLGKYNKDNYEEDEVEKTKEVIDKFDAIDAVNPVQIFANPNVPQQSYYQPAPPPVHPIYQQEAYQSPVIQQPMPQSQPVYQQPVQPVYQQTSAPQPQVAPAPIAQPEPVQPVYQAPVDAAPQVAPAPQPQVQAAPTPQPQVAPAPQPQVQAAPAPQPQVAPAPIAQPEPVQPVYQAPVDAAPQVAPAPQPQVQAASAPQPQVAPAPIAQPEPVQPVYQAPVDAAPQVAPAPQPQVQAASAPQPQVAPAPIAQPEPVQPVYQAPVEPVYQQPVQPMYQQPVYQPQIQPVYQPLIQPVYQQPVQPMHQQPMQPVYQQSTEEFDDLDNNRTSYSNEKEVVKSNRKTRKNDAYNADDFATDNKNSVQKDTGGIDDLIRELLKENEQLKKRNDLGREKEAVPSTGKFIADTKPTSVLQDLQSDSDLYPDDDFVTMNNADDPIMKTLENSGQSYPTINRYREQRGLREPNYVDQNITAPKVTEINELPQRNIVSQPIQSKQEEEILRIKEIEGKFVNKPSKVSSIKNIEALLEPGNDFDEGGSDIIQENVYSTTIQTTNKKSIAERFKKVSGKDRKEIIEEANKQEFISTSNLLDSEATDKSASSKENTQYTIDDFTRDSTDDTINDSLRRVESTQNEESYGDDVVSQTMRLKKEMSYNDSQIDSISEKLEDELINNEQKLILEKELQELEEKNKALREKEKEISDSIDLDDFDFEESRTSIDNRLANERNLLLSTQEKINENRKEKEEITNKLSDSALSDNEKEQILERIKYLEDEYAQYINNIKNIELNIRGEQSRNNEQIQKLDSLPNNVKEAITVKQELEKNRQEQKQIEELLKNSQELDKKERKELQNSLRDLEKHENKLEKQDNKLSRNIDLSEYDISQQKYQNTLEEKSNVFDATQQNKFGYGGNKGSISDNQQANALYRENQSNRIALTQEQEEKLQRVNTINENLVQKKQEAEEVKNRLINAQELDKKERKLAEAKSKELEKEIKQLEKENQKVSRKIDPELLNFNVNKTSAIDEYDIDEIENNSLIIEPFYGEWPPVENEKIDAQKNNVQFSQDNVSGLKINDQTLDSLPNNVKEAITVKQELEKNRLNQKNLEELLNSQQELDKKERKELQQNLKELEKQENKLEKQDNKLSKTVDLTNYDISELSNKGNQPVVGSDTKEEIISSDRPYNEVQRNEYQDNIQIPSSQYNQETLENDSNVFEQPQGREVESIQQSIPQQQQVSDDKSINNLQDQNKIANEVSFGELTSEYLNSPYVQKSNELRSKINENDSKQKQLIRELESTQNKKEAKEINNEIAKLEKERKNLDKEKLILEKENKKNKDSNLKEAISEINPQQTEQIKKINELKDEINKKQQQAEEVKNKLSNAQELDKKERKLAEARSKELEKEIKQLEKENQKVSRRIDPELLNKNSFSDSNVNNNISNQETLENDSNVFEQPQGREVESIQQSIPQQQQTNELPTQVTNQPVVGSDTKEEIISSDRPYNEVQRNEYQDNIQIPSSQYNQETLENDSNVFDQPQGREVESIQQSIPQQQTNELPTQVTNQPVVGSDTKEEIISSDRPYNEVQRNEYQDNIQIPSSQYNQETLENDSNVFDQPQGREVESIQQSIPQQQTNELPTQVNDQTLDSLPNNVKEAITVKQELEKNRLNQKNLEELLNSQQELDKKERKELQQNLKELEKQENKLEKQDNKLSKTVDLTNYDISELSNKGKQPVVGSDTKEEIISSDRPYNEVQRNEYQDNIQIPSSQYNQETLENDSNVFEQPQGREVESIQQSIPQQQQTNELPTQVNDQTLDSLPNNVKEAITVKQELEKNRLNQKNLEELLNSQQELDKKERKELQQNLKELEKQENKLEKQDNKLSKTVDLTNYDISELSNKGNQPVVGSDTKEEIISSDRPYNEVQRNEYQDNIQIPSSQYNQETLENDSNVFDQPQGREVESIQQSIPQQQQQVSDEKSINNLQDQNKIANEVSFGELTSEYLNSPYVQKSNELRSKINENDSKQKQLIRELESTQNKKEAKEINNEIAKLEKERKNLDKEKLILEKENKKNKDSNLKEAISEINPQQAEQIKKINELKDEINKKQQQAEEVKNKLSNAQELDKKERKLAEARSKELEKEIKQLEKENQKVSRKIDPELLNKNSFSDSNVNNNISNQETLENDSNVFDKPQGREVESIQQSIPQQQTNELPTQVTNQPVVGSDTKEEIISSDRPYNEVQRNEYQDNIQIPSSQYNQETLENDSNVFDQPQGREVESIQQSIPQQQTNELPTQVTNQPVVGSDTKEEIISSDRPYNEVQRNEYPPLIKNSEQQLESLNIESNSKPNITPQQTKEVKKLNELKDEINKKQQQAEEVKNKLSNAQELDKKERKLAEARSKELEKEIKQLEKENQKVSRRIDPELLNEGGQKYQNKNISEQDYISLNSENELTNDNIDITTDMSVSSKVKELISQLNNINQNRESILNKINNKKIDEVEKEKLQNELEILNEEDDNITRTLDLTGFNSDYIKNNKVTPDAVDTVQKANEIRNEINKKQQQAEEFKNRLRNAQELDKKERKLAEAKSKELEKEIKQLEKENQKVSRKIDPELLNKNSFSDSNVKNSISNQETLESDSNVFDQPQGREVESIQQSIQQQQQQQVNDPIVNELQNEPIENTLTDYESTFESNNTSGLIRNEAVSQQQQQQTNELPTQVTNQPVVGSDTKEEIISSDRPYNEVQRNEYQDNIQTPSSQYNQETLENDSNVFDQPQGREVESIQQSIPQQQTNELPINRSIEKTSNLQNQDLTEILNDTSNVSYNESQNERYKTNDLESLPDNVKEVFTVKQELEKNRLNQKNLEELLNSQQGLDKKERKELHQNLKELEKEEGKLEKRDNKLSKTIDLSEYDLSKINNQQPSTLEQEKNIGTIPNSSFENSYTKHQNEKLIPNNYNNNENEVNRQSDLTPSQEKQIQKVNELKDDINVKQQQAEELKNRLRNAQELDKKERKLAEARSKELEKEIKQLEKQNKKASKRIDPELLKENTNNEFEQNNIYKQEALEIEPNVFNNAEEQPILKALEIEKLNESEIKQAYKDNIEKINSSSEEKGNKRLEKSQIKDLENKIKDLQEQNNKLEVKYKQLNPSDNINSLNNNIRTVEEDKPSYLTDDFDINAAKNTVPQNVRKVQDEEQVQRLQDQLDKLQAQAQARTVEEDKPSYLTDDFDINAAKNTVPQNVSKVQDEEQVQRLQDQLDKLQAQAQARTVEEDKPSYLTDDFDINAAKNTVPQNVRKVQDEEQVQRLQDQLDKLQAQAQARTVEEDKPSYLTDDFDINAAKNTVPQNVRKVQDEEQVQRLQDQLDKLQAQAQARTVEEDKPSYLTDDFDINAARAAATENAIRRQEEERKLREQLEEEQNRSIQQTRIPDESNMSQNYEDEDLPSYLTDDFDINAARAAATENAIRRQEEERKLREQLEEEQNRSIQQTRIPDESNMSQNYEDEDLPSYLTDDFDINAARAAATENAIRRQEEERKLREQLEEEQNRSIQQTRIPDESNMSQNYEDEDLPSYLSKDFNIDEYKKSKYTQNNLNKTIDEIYPRGSNPQQEYLNALENGTITPTETINATSMYDSESLQEKEKFRNDENNFIEKYLPKRKTIEKSQSSFSNQETTTTTTTNKSEEVYGEVWAEPSESRRRAKGLEPVNKANRNNRPADMTFGNVDSDNALFSNKMLDNSDPFGKPAQQVNRSPDTKVKLQSKKMCNNILNQFEKTNVKNNDLYRLAREYEARLNSGNTSSKNIETIFKNLVHKYKNYSLPDLKLIEIIDQYQNSKGKYGNNIINQNYDSIKKLSDAYKRAHSTQSIINSEKAIKNIYKTAALSDDLALQTGNLLKQKIIRNNTNSRDIIDLVRRMDQYKNENNLRLYKTTLQGLISRMWGE